MKYLTIGGISQTPQRGAQGQGEDNGDTGHGNLAKGKGKAGIGRKVFPEDGG